MGKSPDTERQIVSRLHRLEGQVRSLERVLGSGNAEQAIAQFEAVIAAAKSAYHLYLESRLIEATTEERTKLLRRLVSKL